MTCSDDIQCILVWCDVQWSFWPQSQSTWHSSFTACSSRSTHGTSQLNKPCRHFSQDLCRVFVCCPTASQGPCRSHRGIDGKAYQKIKCVIEIAVGNVWMYFHCPLSWSSCYILSCSNFSVGQGRYNCPVGLDLWLGPSAIPWSSPVIIPRL